jgi:hypothetical protein
MRGHLINLKRRHECRYRRGRGRHREKMARARAREPRVVREPGETYMTVSALAMHGSYGKRLRLFCMKTSEA